MQTFLPYPDFSASARVLDNRRLGKQRVETLQILNALTNPSYGWRNHPAVKMWKGHEQLLALYGLEICREWIARGYKDTCLDKIQKFAPADLITTQPAWLGDEPFHASHRSNLLRKEPAHYAQFQWTDGPDLPYVWPCA
jgi:hypothetical protein